MKKIITLCALLLLGCVYQKAMAQEREITGKVTSKDDNKPIPGVTVVVKGTTIGAATDLDGNYTLRGVPADAKTLVFSAVGLKSQEIPITAANNVDLVMEADVLKLNEVVVTALGISQEKRALAYETQTVGGNELNQSGTGNVLNELQGKVAGLNVISSSGDAGAGTFINLRGITSITGNNQPIIVVDGNVIDNSINAFDPTNGGNPSKGPFSNVTGGVSTDNRALDINPNDIASVTALKGPAATALYGIKASGGALIITTKRGGGVGKAGPTISISSSTGWTSTNKLPDLQNTYAQGTGGVYSAPPNIGSSAGRRVTWGPKISTLAWDNVPTPWDPHGTAVPVGTAGSTPMTPYNSEDFFITGYVLDNNIGIAGGNDKSGYRMSIGNIHQKGVIPLTGYDKTTFSLNGQSNLTKKLSASAGVTYIKSQRDAAQQGSNTSGVMLGLLRTPPSFSNSYGIDPKDAADHPEAYVLADGTQRNYRAGIGYDNPYWTVNRVPYHQDLDRVFGVGQLDYHLLDWMTLSGRLGGDMYLQATKNAYDINSQAFPAGALFLNDYVNKQFSSDIILNMQKRFNADWNGSLLLGHNYQTQFFNQRQLSGSSFALPTWFDISNAQTVIDAESQFTIHRMAEYAQAQIGWRDQLFLTVTGRNEISSTLPANNDVFFYPSVALGWIFTEPLGLTSNKTFSYGKVRASYAGVGNDALPQSLQTYYGTSFVTNGFTTNGGVTWPFEGVAGYAFSSPTRVYGNPDLKPEHTNAYEAGLDLVFFQNRLSLNATYYNQKSIDQILTVPIPYSAGNGAIIANAGTITNKGVELTLTTTPIKTSYGLQWDLTFNWSHNENVVEALAPGIQTLLLGGFTNGGVYAVAGQPYGVIYGTTFVRVNQNDLSSPIVINDDPSDPGFGMPIAGALNQALGTIQPKWLGSVVSNLTFKGVTLGFQINVRHGGLIWDGTRGAIDYFGTGADTKDRGATTVFSGPLGHLDADGNLVHYTDVALHTAPGPGSGNTSTATLGQYYWQNIGSSFVGPTEPNVEDGSYVKLREVSLSFAFPAKWVSKMHFTNLSLGVFADNIILDTKYKGVDPETSLGGPSNGQGLDYFNNPGVKTIGFRVNAGF